MPTDKQLVAAKQTYEVAYFKRKYGIPATVIRALMKELNTRSRKRIMAVLRERGLIHESQSS